MSRSAGGGELPGRPGRGVPGGAAAPGRGGARTRLGPLLREQGATPLRTVLALLAGLSLLLEYGAELSERWRTALAWLEVALAGLFAVELVLDARRSRSPRAFLRRHGYEVGLLLLLVVSLAVTSWIADRDGGAGLLRTLHVHSIPRLYLVLVQVYLFGTSLLRLVRAQELLLERDLRPELLLIGSFLLLVLLGTLLLSLPRATRAGGLTLVDALFTATSAACVTGLVVVDTGTAFTDLGQAVLLLLFQVGGLGIVTFVSFASILSGRPLSLPHMLTVRSLVSAPTMGEVRRRVVLLIAFALAIELVGALALYLSLPADAELGGARAWWAVFHSVSAFCNAGFSLEADSLCGLRSALGVNAILALLLVLGGLGAPVVGELLRLGRHHIAQLGRRRRRTTRPMQLQAKLALVPTLVLLPVGALAFRVLEHGHTLEGLGQGEALVAACFQSASTRTAGFNSLDFGAMSDATLLVTTGLMIVGASPVSTGGGIKTLTLALLVLTLVTVVRGRPEVETRRRTIAQEAIRAALGVFLLYLLTMAAGILVLSLTDPAIALRDRIFETVSALSTVGLSTGVTASWSVPGKLVLCLLMFLGRVGPLSIMLTVFRPQRSASAHTYPSEDVILG